MAVMAAVIFSQLASHLGRAGAHSSALQLEPFTHNRSWSIATVGVYDPSWPRPPGLSYEQACDRGLWISEAAPSAWETPRPSNGWACDNSGNGVWSYAAHELLSHSLPMQHQRSALYSDSEDFAALYIATGPIVGTGADSQTNSDRFRYLQRVINAVARPTIVLGLGVLHAATNDCSATPSAGSIAFLHALKERFAQHGGFAALRGDCTKNILAQAGFNEANGFYSLGCPSLFADVNKKPDHGRNLQAAYTALASRIQTGNEKLKIGLLCSKQAPAVNKALARFVKERGAQGSLLLMQDQTDVACSATELSTGATIERNIFYDVKSWMSAISQLDVIIGPRIHGSMIALAMGVPTITIVIDERIRELCQRMLLAYAESTDFASGLDQGQVASLVVAVAQNFDGTAFDLNRREISGRYVKLLSDACGSSCKPHPHLLTLAGGLG
jgi:hypothetical protein